MTRTLTWLSTALLVLAVGCDKKEPAKAEPAKAEPAKAQPSAAQPPLAEPAAARASAEQTLKSYEAVRAKLAADDTSGMADAAKQIATSARAAGSANAKDKAHYDAIAKAADDLSAKAGDIDPARAAFGEVSRHVVELLKANPSLRSGQTLFHCPMAKGFQNWVQPNAKLENPYMGKKMLECGAQEKWDS